MSSKVSGYIVLFYLVFISIEMTKIMVTKMVPSVCSCGQLRAFIQYLKSTLPIHRYTYVKATLLFYRKYY